MTFSKHGLHAQKFRCTITPLWQPAVAKWCALESPFFLVSHSNALQLQYAAGSVIQETLRAAKPQFASAQGFFHKGNDGVH
jgi:hypothetical protein